MKFKVIHTVVQAYPDASSSRQFFEGDTLTRADLRDSGADESWLLSCGAINVVEGTENEADDMTTTEEIDAQILRLQAQKLEAQALRISSPDAPATAGAADLTLADDALAAKLLGAGYDTPEKVRQASDDDLLKVPGIGPASIDKIRAMQS